MVDPHQTLSNLYHAYLTVLKPSALALQQQWPLPLITPRLLRLQMTTTTKRFSLNRCVRLVKRVIFYWLSRLAVTARTSLKRWKQRYRDMTIIAFTGKDGGEMAGLLGEHDVENCIPSHRTARIHEVHMVTLHRLCDLIDQVLFPAHEEWYTEHHNEIIYLKTLLEWLVFRYLHYLCLVVLAFSLGAGSNHCKHCHSTRETLKRFGTTTISNLKSQPSLINSHTVVAFVSQQALTAARGGINGPSNNRCWTPLFWRAKRKMYRASTRFTIRFAWKNLSLLALSVKTAGLPRKWNGSATLWAEWHQGESHHWRFRSILYWA